MKLISTSEKQTYIIGENIAKNITPGTIITLDGDLGAGKTAITKGIANGLKIRANVNSPTYVILKVYPVKQNKNIKNFCHVDGYRITDKTHSNSLGLEEYLDNKKNIIVIEWPKNLSHILRKYKDRTLKVKIVLSKKESNIRHLTISK